ncbi:hypothetical protein [Roseomonas chloroacetimidivorans]|uniref:hypothetical protein n=1 Tax=Roseomonas chloroacetimidivorans TaxID=1766656 RepID=UPI003C726BF5
MRLIAALFLTLIFSPPAMAQPSLPGFNAEETENARAVVSNATFAAFCEWRSNAWAQDYLLFIVQEVAGKTRIARAASDFVISTKDAAAREIMNGDLRGNCARRYNPAALAEMERARGAGQIPSLAGLR